MVYWFYIPRDELSLFQSVVQNYQLSHINCKMLKTAQKPGWQQTGKDDWKLVHGEYIVVFRTKQERDHVEMIYQMMKGEERLPVSLAA